ncbi:MAG: hypothetical protein HQL10_14010 [Nitrospirae bacterium]|nr:hypothetical protein [Nitrospirota bacterium]
MNRKEYTFTGRLSDLKKLAYKLYPKLKKEALEKGLNKPHGGMGKIKKRKVKENGIKKR